MPISAADSVRVIWTGTGTGTMSLGAAVAGFQGFPATLDGQLISYAIENEAGTERENGIGTYTASGTTLTRERVTFSTAGAPTKVPFSAGTKHVRIVALAHDIIENRAATDPTAGDDVTQGYIAGRARWFNTATGLVWFCVDHSVGTAVWAPVLHLADSSSFSPAAVNLAANREFDPYTQTGAVAFALAAVTEVPGAWSSVEFTGNGSAITYSADFRAIDGSSLTESPYSGFTGTRRLILMWSGAQAKALVAWSSTASGGGGSWGDITGTLSAQTDLQAALDASPAKIAQRDTRTVGTTASFDADTDLSNPGRFIWTFIGASVNFTLILPSAAAIGWGRLIVNNTDFTMTVRNTDDTVTIITLAARTAVPLYRHDTGVSSFDHGDFVFNLTAPGLVLSEVTSSRALAAGDARQKMLRATHTTVPIVLTVPLEATVPIPANSVINIARWGAAGVSVIAEAGVTINKPADRTLVVREQFEVITLWKATTNTWLAFGGLA